MKKLTLISTLLLVVFSSCTHRLNDSSHGIKDFALNQTAAEALISRVLLTEIRENRASNAIESLEFSIDCSVVTMGGSTNCAPATQRQIDLALRMLKEYRRKYPRELQALAAGKDEFEERARMAREAEEILKRVE